MDDETLDLALKFNAGILLLWTATLNFLSVGLEMLDFGLKPANLFSTALCLLLVGLEFRDEISMNLINVCCLLLVVFLGPRVGQRARCCGSPPPCVELLLAASDPEPA